MHSFPIYSVFLFYPTFRPLSLLHILSQWFAIVTTVYSASIANSEQLYIYKCNNDGATIAWGIRYSKYIYRKENIPLSFILVHISFVYCKYFKYFRGKKVDLNPFDWLAIGIHHPDPRQYNLWNGFYFNLCLRWFEI